MFGFFITHKSAIFRAEPYSLEAVALQKGVLAQI